MSTRWKKVFRDFSRESTRTLLVVLAIAVSIAGFSAVLASYAILTRELNRGYLATNPASITLRTDRVDDALLAAVAAHPGVRTVEARRVLGGRIRKGQNAWRNLVLFVVQDFAAVRVSKVTPEQGAWPPARGEILIERDALQVARAGIGDVVTVRTTNGPERTLHVSGTVHDVGQAQARMENVVYGYISRDTLAGLGVEPVLNQLLVVVSGDAPGDTNDERRIRAVAAAVETVIESRGHEVTDVDVPPPGKHPHADLMGLLMLSLASFGLFVMILSGVIVVNLLTGLMAAQTRQIGVMKAIGATRGQIARIYLGQALLLGAVAVVLAIPAGIWGSRALCRAMAVFLNFDITSFAIPAWVFLLVAILGLIVPLLAAAYPVWKGTAVPVRQALGTSGVAGDRFGVTRFERLLAGTGGAARPLLLALRNSFRRRTRLVLTVATLACAGLFFMTALNLRASMIATLDRLFAAKRFDLSLIVNGMASVDAVNRAIVATPGVRRAETWLVRDATLGASGLVVIALPPATSFFAPDVESGRWLHEGEKDTIVVNTALAAKSAQMKVGNRVTLPMGSDRASFRVVGVVRDAFAPPTAYVPRAFFPGGLTNSVRLVLEKNDTASMDRAKGLLETAFGREGIRVSSMTGKNENRYGFDQHMLMIYVALILMSMMIGGVGGLGLMTSMSLNVLERRREMGVLRAVGATPRMVLLMLVVEGSVIAVLSWALAGLAAWPLSRALGDLLSAKLLRGALDFTFELRGLLVWLALTLLLGAIASVIPAWHATRHPVREALGYE